MKKNISFINWPYYGLESFNGAQDGKWAVFFGADFKNMPEVNLDKFIEKTNACLDYIRKNCSDCQLIYRAHPDEKNEADSLDLRSFSIQKDNNVAEDFLMENRKNIKYVFSICSTSSIAAFNMGFNSYIFYNYFGDIVRGAYKNFVSKYFSGFPPSFFIENLNIPLLQNKIELKKDNKLIGELSGVLSKNKGTVWFIVVENRFIPGILGFAGMIREISPGRKINLIISKHHRWSDDKLKELKTKFDEVLVFPRVFYSLRPSRILSAIKISRNIKKTFIENGSVFIGFAHHDFIENCFISYNKDKFNISCLLETTWELNFKSEELGLNSRKFVFNKAGLFFNKILEPLLGLNRTMFMHYGGESNLYLIRLQKPIEDIYDRVYLIRNSPID